MESQRNTKPHNKMSNKLTAALSKVESILEFVNTEYLSVNNTLEWLHKANGLLSEIVWYVTPPEKKIIEAKWAEIDALIGAC